VTTNPQTSHSAFITVIGRDRVGIIAEVSRILADVNANINDISQTILQENFTMIMLIDTAKMTIDIKELADRMEAKGQELGLSILVRHADIYRAMHRI
jgi:ACT domain-containing protein